MPNWNQALKLDRKKEERTNRKYIQQIPTNLPMLPVIKVTQDPEQY
jgi:hypothetical protein